jgi:hypothetical protein
VLLPGAHYSRPMAGPRALPLFVCTSIDGGSHAQSKKTVSYSPLQVEGNMTAFRDGRYPIDSFIMDYDWFLTGANPDQDFDYDPKM